MADVKKPYRRLPGTGYRRILPGWVLVILFFVIGIFALLFRGRRNQLWQGEEHLLLVESDGHREYYKRFRYQDIQAVIIRKTAEGKIMNGILAVIVVFFAAIGLSVNQSGARIFLLVLAGSFLALLLLNTLFGPTCSCQLRTAVQVADLPSLDRLRRAHKVLNRLRPQIAAAQGQLAPEEIPARMRELIAPAADAQKSPAASAAPAQYVVDDLNQPPRIIS
jgi:hypothetical protein